MTSPGGTRQVRVVIAADVASAIQGFRQVSEGLGGVSQAGEAATATTSSWGDKLKNALANLGVQTGFDGIKAGFSAVMDIGLSYEGSMNTLQAVTGATADEMARAGALAKQLGNDVSIPGASAQGTAAALSELAKGGLKLDESMQAVRGTMILAAAAQIDGAQAAEIQANALNTFGLKADQAGRVANVLANVANQSSGEITDFSQGLEQAGTVANSFGWSIEETTTMLGLMANAGIKGSDAGTSLKTTMTSMLKPTEQQAAALAELGVKTRDANGNMISAKDFTAELTAAKGRMSEADFSAAAATAFGTDAVRTAFVAAQQGTKGYDEMATALTNVTGAQDVAAANSAGVNGAIDRITNSAQTVALTLYEKMAPAMTSILDVGTSLVGTLGELIGWFADLPTPIQATTLAIGGMIALRGPLTAMWTSMSTAISTATLSLASIRVSMAEAGMSASGMRVAMMAASIGVRTMGTALKTAFLANPIGIALVAATTAFSLFASAQDDATGSAEDFTSAIDDSTGALNDNAAAALSEAAGKSGGAAAYEALGGKVSDYVDALGGIPEKQELVNKTIEDAKNKAREAGVEYGALAVTADGMTVETGAATQVLGEQSGAFDAATKAGQIYAGDLANLGTAQADQKREIAGANGELAKVPEVVAPAAQSMEDYTKALEAATKNAQILSDNTALEGMLAAFKASADDASRAADLFKIKLDELDGRSRSLDDATADQQKTLAALADAWKAGTAAATENTEAGNLNTQALLDWDVKALTATSDGRSLYGELSNMADQHMATASAAYSDAVAHGDVAGAAGIARAAADESRKAFLELAGQHGLNEEQAVQLADKLGIVDGTKIDDKFFQTINDDAEAKRKLEEMQAAEIADKTFKITALAGVDQASLDAANAKAVNFGYAATDYTPYQQHADGGWVSGPGGPKEDKVKAALSPGEFVVNAASAARNKGLLEAINGARMGFADGGSVPAAGAGASADVAVSSAVTVPDVAGIQAAWDLIAKAVADAWASVIQPALLALSVQNAATSAEILALRDVSVVPAWDGIGASVSTTTNAVLLPTYDSLNAGTTATAAAWQSLLDATVTPVWAGISNAIQVSWAGTVSPVYDMLNAGSNNAGQQFLNLAGTTDNAWSRIGSTISGVYSGNIVPAWDGVQGFSNATGDFFGGVQSGMSAAKDQIVSDLDEITTEINKFFDMVDGKTAGTPGATATASVTPTFADGGLITMGTGPRTDDVHIRASKGEYVVNAASTAKHRDALDAINYGGAFADGGVVGEKISGNIQEKIQAGALAALDAVVTKTLAAFPQTYAGFSGPAPAGARGEFLKAILSKQGTEYVWGAAGPDVFDCSGLMSWGLEQAGVGKGRLTAEGFNSGWPHIPNPKPGDMVTFDTGRLPGQAGHIGAVLDPNAGTMMHTDGAGPARISDFRSRSGLLGFVDPIGGEYTTVPVDDSKGDPPASGKLAAIIKKIQAGGTGAAPAVSYTATGGVEQWRDEVLFSLAFLGESASLADAVLNQVRTESSGNPNAINLTDSNAMKGTPSKGLVQVIDPTFRSYALAPYNQNIWDPISNLIAGENYARHQYGSIAAGMQGHAYDTGGVWPTGTAGWNTTGGPEYVLKPHEWAVAQSAMNHVINNGGTTNNSGQTINVGGITMANASPQQAISEMMWQARLSS